MKHFVKRIKGALCVLLTALLLASCGDIGGDETAANNGLVTLRIAVDEDGFRTAYPQITALSGFIKFSLTGNGKPLGSWSKTNEYNAYTLMTNDGISVVPGKYTFELTGMTSTTFESATAYKGTQTVDVTADTVLNFTLSFAGLSTSSDGYLGFSATYPIGSTEADTVTRIEAWRSKYASVTARTLPADVTPNMSYCYPNNGSTSTNTEAGTKTWTVDKQRFTPGKYLVEYKFYATVDGKNVLLANIPEIAYVSYGYTTYSSVAVSDFDDIYMISYGNADDATLAEGSTQPLYYTWKSDIKLPQMTKTGYTFGGWFTEQDEDGQGTGTEVTGWTSGEKTGDITVYAKWTKAKFAVRFHKEAYGETLSDTPFAEQAIEYGEYTESPETDPTKDGYDFKGWITSLEEGLYDFDTKPITGELDLYALWVFEVNFNKNADDAEGEMEALKCGNSYLGGIANPLPANAFTYAGHSFLGWATVADDEAVYPDGAENVADDIHAAATLYAKWHDDAAGHVVTFVDPDSGSVLGKQEVATDGKATELAGPKKEDYQFVGWYTGTVDSSTGVVTLDSDPYDFTAIVETNLTLYAKLERNVYYVSTEGDSTNGDGTKEKPFSTFSSAVDKIGSTGCKDVDYIIVFSGTLNESLSIGTTLTAENAKSLTVRGATGNETDQVHYSGTVVNIWTTIPVTLSDMTITATGSGNRLGLSVATDSTVTLESGARITGVYNSYSSKSGAGASVSGTLIMKDGAEISNNTMSSYSTKGAGVFVNGGGSFTMDGGLITGNKLTYPSNGCDGAGVYVNGTFVMNGGEITNNSTDSGYGGGVYFYGANGYKFEMTGGKISENTAVMGGGVYDYGYGAAPFTMTGGEISGNTTTSDGGGVYIYASNANTPFALEGGKIIGNKARGNGGGVYLNNGVLTLAGGEISDNTTAVGGGVYLKNGTFTMNGGSISGNTATNTGGGVYLYNNSSFTLNDGSIDGNSSKDAGGVYYYGGSGAKWTMNGGEISGNTATGYGGGVYNYCYSGSTTPFAMTAGKISNNTARYGGGVYDRSSSTGYRFTMSGGTISGNTAVYGGGLYRAGHFAMTGGTISDNRATTYGGAVYSPSSYTFSMANDAYIPAGEYGDNDVYLENSSSSYITVTAPLTATVPVATITTISTYQIITASGSEVTLSDVYNKFALTDKTYVINTSGKRMSNINGYSITYKDGGNTDFSGTYGRGTPTSRLSGETTTLVDATKEHATFDGWFKESDCSGTAVTALTDEDFTGSSITLYAKWTEDVSYSIFYMDEGGKPLSGTSMSTPSTIRYKGEPAYRIPSMFKDHYTFGGWFKEIDCSGTAITELNDENCTENLTLYAKWTEDTKYTLTYKDVGGTDRTGKSSWTLAAVRYKGASAYTIPTLSKDGYYFVGWFVNEDGSGDAVTVLNDENCTKDLTLYAKWVKETIDTVIVDTNNLLITASGSTLVASDGFEGYSWTFNGKSLATIKGFAVSDDGKTVTITNDDLLPYFGYVVTLTATKNGLTYITNYTVNKQ